MDDDASDPLAEEGTEMGWVPGNQGLAMGGDSGQECNQQVPRLPQKPQELPDSAVGLGRREEDVRVEEDARAPLRPCASS
jgi:hypothetical protein